MTPKKRIEDSVKILERYCKENYSEPDNITTKKFQEIKYTLALFITIGKNLSEERISNVINEVSLLMANGETKYKVGDIFGEGYELTEIAKKVLSELVKEKI